MVRLELLNSQRGAARRAEAKLTMKTNKTPPPNDGAIDDEAEFDVRAIPGRVKHAQIFQRWLNLPVGDYFVLLNDHDPIPLRYQFNAEFPQAFTWEYIDRGPEEFRVKITKLLPVTAPAPAAAASAGPALAAPPGAGDTQELDVRGLEPPEPLIRILDALEKFPASRKLRARTDREPCHLFGEAAQRGFRHECQEQPDGSWLTTLERA